MSEGVGVGRGGIWVGEGGPLKRNMFIVSPSSHVHPLNGLWVEVER